MLGNLYKAAGSTNALKWCGSSFWQRTELKALTGRLFPCISDLPLKTSGEQWMRKSAFCFTKSATASFSVGTFNIYVNPCLRKSLSAWLLAVGQNYPYHLVFSSVYSAPIGLTFNLSQSSWFKLQMAAMHCSVSEVSSPAWSNPSRYN